MLRFLFAMSIIVVCGCIDSDDNPVYEESSLTTPAESLPVDNKFYRDEAWVCYHPGTEMHNKECVEETYPNGCYLDGDSSVFCWLLMKPECENPEKYPAAQKACHLLRR